MKITLETNNSPEIPYLIFVELTTITIDAGSVFQVPVQANYQGTEKSFSVEVCGFLIKGPTPQALIPQVDILLSQLINVERLPTYGFIARRAGGIYPVYTINNEVLAITPGGPVFRHVELAKIREYLTDYLHDVGILGEKGLSDKLHVRGVNMHTLGLRRPVMYLKKRVPGEVDFWAPVFESSDGKRIYTYAADARRQVPSEAGQEIIILRELVAQTLLTAKRLKNLYDLRPDRLLPAYWERLEASLTPEGSIMVNGLELPLYSNSYLWIAVETRDEDPVRYSLFVGENAVGVQRRAQQDFDRRGIRVVSEAAAFV